MRIAFIIDNFFVSGFFGFFFHRLYINGTTCISLLIFVLRTNPPGVYCTSTVQCFSLTLVIEPLSSFVDYTPMVQRFYFILVWRTNPFWVYCTSTVQRFYLTSVFEPLSSSIDYTPMVQRFYLILVSRTNPSWVYCTSMVQRFYLTLVFEPLFSFVDYTPMVQHFQFRSSIVPQWYNVFTTCVDYTPMVHRLFIRRLYINGTTFLFDFGFEV